MGRMSLQFHKDDAPRFGGLKLGADDRCNVVVATL